MTRVRITGLDKEIKNIRERIFTAVKDSDFEKPLAREVRAKIRKDGIDPDLAPSTKRFRSKVVSRKGPNFQPGKSSLTLSGQLLGAMYSIFQTTRSRAFFAFGVKNDAHKPYRVQGKKKIYKTSATTALIDIWNGLMRDRPVTKVFDDREFKVKIERRLVSAIKRFIK